MINDINLWPAVQRQWIINQFYTEYDHHLIMGDFSMELNNRMFKSFLGSNNLSKLIKTNTCFKREGSQIDLILTNRKYSFKYISSYEIWLSDHDNMIYIMLNSSLINIEPKLLDYRDYKIFNFGNFKEDLNEALLICRISYYEFESAFKTALDKHAPKTIK